MTQCPRCAGGGTVVADCGKQGPVTLTCSDCAGLGMVTPAYAGIGSRETPAEIGLEMQAIAMQLALRGFILRSGAASPKHNATPGTVSADREFEKGCDMVAGRKVIRTRTHHAPALAHAAHYHPAWERCSDIAQALHARNSLVMMGDRLDNPVRFVVCWTPGDAITGGTGQALRIARAENIAVFNLASMKQSDLWAWLDQGVA